MVEKMEELARSSLTKEGMIREKMFGNEMGIMAPRTKHKRRSKNDIDGRDHKCGCGKTYLSYPALYTHIKTKHSGTMPDGTSAPQIQGSRGRGRPRKVEPGRGSDVGKYEGDMNGDEYEPIREKEAAEEQKSSGFNEDEFLKDLGVQGGPISALDSFDELIHAVANPTLYETLFQYVKSLSSTKEKKEVEGEGNVEDKGADTKILIDNINLNPPNNDNYPQNGNQVINHDETKICDQIFAEYLIYVAQRVSDKFFKTVIIFIRYYRECMNEYGWEIVSRYREVKSEERKKIFCNINNAEHVPEASNDFIRIFLPKEFDNFDRNLAVQLTRHMCHWLYQHKYTHSRVTLM